MYQALTEDILVPIDGAYIRITVHIWQPEAPIATLICIHDFFGCGTDFSVLGERLAMSGIKVVAPDLPGRGQSSSFNERGSYILKNYMQCLAHLKRFREKSAYYMGTGWGGALALSYLAFSGTKAAKLILNDATIQYRPSLHPAETTITPPALRAPHDPTLDDLVAHGRPYDLWPLVGSILIPCLFLIGRNSKDLDHARLDQTVNKLDHITVIRNLDDEQAGRLLGIDRIFIILGFLLAAPHRPDMNENDLDP